MATPTWEIPSVIASCLEDVANRLEKAAEVVQRVAPDCPRCKSSARVWPIHQPEVYEFAFFCGHCDQGFN